MSRADLLVNLVNAGSQGDQQLFRTTVEAMAAEEAAPDPGELLPHESVPGAAGGSPVVALLDGLPLQNHPLLAGRGPN